MVSLRSQIDFTTKVRTTQSLNSKSNVALRLAIAEDGCNADEGQYAEREPNKHPFARDEIVHLRSVDLGH